MAAAIALMPPVAVTVSVPVRFPVPVSVPVTVTVAVPIVLAVAVLGVAVHTQVDAVASLTTALQSYVPRYLPMTVTKAACLH